MCSRRRLLDGDKPPASVSSDPPAELGDAADAAAADSAAAAELSERLSSLTEDPTPATTAGG